MAHGGSHYLDKPNLEKTTHWCKNNRLYIASSSMQGWRTTNEDCYTVFLKAPNDPECCYCGVYDGHGGANISRHISRHLHKSIMANLYYKRGEIRRGIIEGFLRLDAEMKSLRYLNGWEVGSTAVVVLIKNEIIYVANAGDSRAIGMMGNRLVPLSEDHKPYLSNEEARINAAGYSVTEDGRLNGDLALSRGFGDFRFKDKERLSAREQAVTCMPDVEQWPVTEEWKWIFLACDGIWDVMTKEAVAKFIQNRLIWDKRAEEILEALLDKCVCKERKGHCRVGKDNITAVLIVFLKHMPRSYRVAILPPSQVSVSRPGSGLSIGAKSGSRPGSPSCWTPPKPSTPEKTPSYAPTNPLHMSTSRHLAQSGAKQITSNLKRLNLGPSSPRTVAQEKLKSPLVTAGGLERVQSTPQARGKSTQHGISLETGTVQPGAGRQLRPASPLTLFSSEIRPSSGVQTPDSTQRMGAIPKNTQQSSRRTSVRPSKHIRRRTVSE